MRVADVHLIFEYNYWARDRILAAAERVTFEQYAAPAAYPYGGLRGTLLHILDAEISWRHQLEHGHWTPDLLEADYPTLAVLKDAWQQEEAAMRAFLGRMNDSDLYSTVRYPVDSGEIRQRVLWHCLIHLANHGTQHRAEAAAMLTSYGQSPGDVDYTLFLNERGLNAMAA
jgi:uncharacterized damage-inducible protein DinB